MATSPVNPATPLGNADMISSSRRASSGPSGLASGSVESGRGTRSSARLMLPGSDQVLCSSPNHPQKRSSGTHAVDRLNDHDPLRT
jgi:hypothetical protein